MAGDAPSVINDVGGVAAAVFNWTKRHKQFAIVNSHATQTLTVRPFFAFTSAAAAALAAATPAVIGADDNYTIPPGKRVVIGKSTRPVFCSISTIASGAATTFTGEGTDFRD